MSKTLWVEQLDLVEQQLDEVSAVLLSRDAQALQASVDSLQRASVELLQLLDRTRAADKPSVQSIARLKLLSRRLPALREGLLRQAAVVERALQIVIPSAPKSTYAGTGPYGSGPRQSGALRGMLA